MNGTVKVNSYTHSVSPHRFVKKLSISHWRELCQPLSANRSQRPVGTHAHTARLSRKNPATRAPARIASPIVTGGNTHGIESLPSRASGKNPKTIATSAEYTECITTAITNSAIRRVILQRSSMIFKRCMKSSVWGRSEISFNRFAISRVEERHKQQRHAQNDERDEPVRFLLPPHIENENFPHA
jgi:hypothetical protein